MKKISKFNKILLLVVWFFIAFFTTRWYFDPQIYRIYGSSMWPSLSHGDYCLAIGKFSKIEHREVVIIQDRNKVIVKRIIGLPGDTIKIISGQVFVNNKPENDYDLISNFTQTNLKSFEVILGNNQYFLLGDFRSISYDSRIFGPVNRNLIIAKVIARWKPLNPKTFGG